MTALPTQSERNFMLQRLLLLIPLLLPALSANADIIHVPDDFETIQSAIRDENTVDGDVILIEPGVYMDTINFVGKNIIVASRYYDTGDEDYISRTIVDGNNDHRVVIIRNGVTAQGQLIGLTIRNGRYQWGGGVYIHGSSPTLSRLIIYGNVATSNGGGVYATNESHPVLDHVTIFGNEGETFGALRSYNGSTITITNSIIYGNTPDELPDEMTATYCDLEGGFEGNGNIDEDPAFVNIEEDDFHLAGNSGCIDTGDPDDDLDPDGTRADMGALSYFHTPAIAIDPLSIDFGSARLNTNVDVDLTITNAGAVPLSIEAITITGENSPFSIVNGGDPVELDPEAELIVTVRFSPGEPGDYADNLVIVSDDPNDDEITVALTGIGLTPTPELEINPLRIDFGETALRQTENRTITITNSGDALLNIVSFDLFDETGAFDVRLVGSAQIQPEEQVEFHVSLQTMELHQYEATLRLLTNDLDEDTVDIRLTGTGVLPEKRYRFAENTGVNHSFLILSCEISGEPPALGSEIGIFTENDLCCGGDFWLGERFGLAAWGDNEMTEEVDGWIDDEAFNFKIWDLAAGAEVIPQIEIIDGDERFIPNGLTIVNLNVIEAPSGFKIYTSNGWSILAAPAIPEELNVVRLWAPVVQRGHLMMIKDSGGRFYSALFGFSNMQNWDFRQGYQVRGSAVDSLDLGDNIVDPQTEIPLREGWNIVAYFPEQPLTPQIAFANFRDAIHIVKDSNGHFYLPSMGFSNMAPLRRGLGYQVRMIEAVNFVWNIPEQFAAGIQCSESIPPEHFTEPAPTGLSMSLLIESDALREGWEIAAIGVDGNVVGAIQLTGNSPWGMAVWGDDVSTPEKDGAIDGEALKLVVFDGYSERSFDAVWSQKNIFSGDELTFVRLEDAAVPERLRLDSPQPNPFNNATTLIFALPEETRIELAVYDFGGRKLAVLADGQYKAGIHRAFWDAGSMASGVYLARLEANGQSISTKLTLLR